MKKIIVVSGLPGSGKSTHIKETFENKKGYLVISEDYQANAYNDSEEFEDSQHYSKLLETLNMNLIPVIGDLRYCSKKEQNKLVEAIHKINPDIEVKWVFLMTSPEKCKDNIDKRNRATKTKEKALVDQYSRLFSVPDNAEQVYPKQE